MPMYNGLPYVGESIESIINQTFQDWELLVIDDLSTDSSPDLVREYMAKDSRIKLITNNSGVKGEGGARNLGIESARGEYVTMMDADDISLPKRLELQLAFMEKHPEVTMLGANMRTFGQKDWSSDYPTGYWQIRLLVLLKHVICTIPICFRREQVKERYNTNKYGADTHFVSRVILKHRVENISDILYHYRIHSDSISFNVDRITNLRQLYSELLPLRFGFTPTAQQIDTHLAWLGNLDKTSMRALWSWILYILIHGKYLYWYERLMLGVWCMLRLFKWTVMSMIRKLTVSLK